MPQGLTAQSLRRLIYFAAIAETGSIRQAAARLNLSVATVSESLTELEQELGITLATRSTRALKLTSEGRRVQHIASEMISAGEALFTDVVAPKVISGTVAITAPVEIAHSWLPSRLEAFQRKHPNVVLSISASDKIIDIDQSAFDLSIRASFVPHGAPGEGTLSLPLTCAQIQSLKVERFDGHLTAEGTLLTPFPGPSLVVWASDQNQSLRLTFDRFIVVDNKHVALSMAAKGMGSALVTEISLEEYPMLQKGPQTLRYGAIALTFLLRDKRPSAAARALHSFLSAVN